MVLGNDYAAGSNQAEERPVGHLDGSAVSSGPNIAAPTTRRVGRSDDPPDSNRIEDGTQLFGVPSVEDGVCFLNIYWIAMEANAISGPHLIRWVLFALVFALDQYLDYWKSEMTHFVEDSTYVSGAGSSVGFEHTPLKTARMYHLLATSFCFILFIIFISFFFFFFYFYFFLSNSSGSIKRVLEDRWNDTVGGNHIDPNLNMPPLHAAV